MTPPVRVEADGAGRAAVHNVPRNLLDSIGVARRWSREAAAWAVPLADLPAVVEWCERAGRTVDYDPPSLGALVAGEVAAVRNRRRRGAAT